MWKQCSVVPIKDDVACIFARSSRGEKEFPEFSINQRAAVALGRYLQDPLMEIAGGWVAVCINATCAYHTVARKWFPCGRNSWRVRWTGSPEILVGLLGVCSNGHGTAGHRRFAPLFVAFRRSTPPPPFTCFGSTAPSRS